MSVGKGVWFRGGSSLFFWSKPNVDNIDEGNDTIRFPRGLDPTFVFSRIYMSIDALRGSVEEAVAVHVLGGFGQS